MPFGFHLAMDTLPSREPQGAAPGPPWLFPAFAFVPVWVSPYLRPFPGPRGITPAFGYSAPHSSAEGTSTPMSSMLLSTHYATVRLPTDVHVGRLAHGLLQPARRQLLEGRRWGLPVPAHGVSLHARGLRLRGVHRMLALPHPTVWPSAMLNGGGTPIAIISQLNTRPALPPVNASMAALRLATHDSGPG